MKQKQWDLMLAAASGRELPEVPVALIVDSPWIPGYVGMSTLDYYTDQQAWWNSQQKIRADFPDVLFIPDYWTEFGMACEPSGFGCKLNFYENQPITIQHIISSADDVESLDTIALPNPNRDGLMPLVLNYYRKTAKLARDIGDPVRMVAARGPLNVATHMIGVTEFLVAMKIYPESAHKLLKKTSTLNRMWLEAQAEAVGGVEGIMLLDDIIGFLSPEDFEEFAFPYIKDVYDSFSVPVKFLHNDTDNPVSYSRLADMGVNMFNFTFEKSLSGTRKMCGDSVCLVGNIPPLHVLGNGTPEQVTADVLARLDDYGSKKGIIMSAGGGASMGMPGANLQAMITATKEWSGRK